MFNFKRTYNYVNPCKRCDSFKTGFYITVQSENTGLKMRYLHALNGERVRFNVAWDVNNENNVYCEECGARYHDEVLRIKLTSEEIEQQKEVRGISEDYISELEEYSSFKKRRILRKNFRKLKRKLKREERKAKRKNKKEIKIKD